MIEKLKQAPRFLKLNLQHFADTGVSGIANWGIKLLLCTYFKRYRK